MRTLAGHIQHQICRTVLFTCVLVCCFSQQVSAEDQASAAADSSVDFERHIAPLFGRLGCNTAACHGAFGGGKGGFQLSLFGYSPKMDYQGLGVRINRSNAEALKSLRPIAKTAQEVATVPCINNEDQNGTRL